MKAVKEELRKNYNSLLININDTISNAVKNLGGTYHFIEEGDPRLDEIDCLSELDLPLVEAYSYNYDRYGNFYVTGLRIGQYGLEIFGVAESRGVDLEDSDMLDFVATQGLLEIIDKLPDEAEINDTNEHSLEQVPVLVLSRKDIEDAGYCSDVTDTQLKMIASRIEKNLQWQDFNTQFKDDLREASDYCEIPLINKEK